MKSCLILLTLLLSGAQLHAVDTVRFTETLAESVISDNDPDFPSYEVITKISGTFNASVLLPGLDAVVFTDDVEVSFSLGEFSFSEYLENADSSGPASATFYQYNDDFVRVGQITFSRSGNGNDLLTITASSSDLSVQWVAVEDLAGGTGPVRGVVGVQISAAGLEYSNDLIFYTGNSSVTTRVVGSGDDAEEFDLNRVNISGANDTIKPTIAITTPKPGLRWTNEVITITGTAKDNVEVVVVFYKLNDGDWIGAVGTTNWTAEATLIAGTNTLRAYAVDSTGNFSTTNRVSLTYVLSAPLVVQTVGKGTVNPNYNGQLLEIGMRFTMTATPGIGFAFTNWTGSLTTNKAALSFLMQSNLTFTANFVDVQKPTVTITNPAANARLSNAVVTFRGTAKDNDALTRVEYQLNNDPFTLADGTTNWSATVTLPAGTNVFRIKSTDATTNVSLVATQRVFFVVPSQLTLLTNGNGRVTGATNGQTLEVGRGCTLTATPAVGFGLFNWDDGIGIVSTNRILTFRMSTNLLLRANFRDITKPTVTIISPLANARLSNSVVTFQGTARDNVAVDHVEYQLNSDPFTLATGTTNWLTTVTMPAGTNVFRVRSIDITTNVSLVATQRVFFVVPSQLTLCTNGNGRVTGATNGQWLEVGRGYKLTATPALRHIFAIWSEGSSSTNPALTFLMQSNLTLCANFVTNPFVGLKGIYYGLFAETNEVRNHDRSGSFTFTLTEAGSYSASFQLGAKKLPVTGKFDWLGQSWLTLKPSPASNVTVALQLDVTNLNATVVGGVSNQFWWSPLLGYRAPVYLGTNASPLLGKYTLVIPGSDDDSASPGGDGYGTVTVSKGGVATLAGKLGDSTVLNQTIPVASDGLWALYASLYTSKGSVQGWMTFTNEDASDINGILSWIKPAMPTSKYYPLGFTNAPEAVGSRYVAPGTTNRVLNITNGLAAFTGGNLLQAITNNVLLTTNNKVTNLSSNKLTLTLTLPTGLFTGSVTDTNTGKPILFNGALVQKLNAGYGHFLGTNRSGQTLFAPAP